MPPPDALTQSQCGKKADMANFSAPSSFSTLLGASTLGQLSFRRIFHYQREVNRFTLVPRYWQRVMLRNRSCPAVSLEDKTTQTRNLLLYSIIIIIIIIVY